MKSGFVAIFVLGVMLTIPCYGKKRRVKKNEAWAIDKLAAGIAYRYPLKTKRIAVFTFSDKRGSINNASKRVTNILLEKLVKKYRLRLIERSELNKILKAHGVAQTGIIKGGGIGRLGKILPIDVMITGTLSSTDNASELSIKAVNIVTGEIYFVSTVKYSTKKIQNRLAIESCYQIMIHLSKKRPLLYIYIMLKRRDPALLMASSNLSRSLKRFSRKIRKNKRLKRKIIRMRKDLKIMNMQDLKKYTYIIALKHKLIKEWK